MDYTKPNRRESAIRHAVEHVPLLSAIYATRALMARQTINGDTAASVVLREQ